MTVPPRQAAGSGPAQEDLLHRHIAQGIRVHHIILTIAFLLLIILGGSFIISQSHAVTSTAVSSYQLTELEIVRDAARSTREYVYVQTVVLNRTDIQNIEQEVFKKFIKPIHLQKNGDAWIYAPDHVVFDLSADFPDAYRNKSMAQIFAIQKANGASHYEEMTDDVMHAREGIGYYIWLPEKGAEIAAWTPVTIGEYTWVIGLSTPLQEILDATGATTTTRNSVYLFIVGVAASLILFLAWLRADIRRWQYEEILRESEERYAAIVNSAPGPVLILRQGKVHFINDAGIRASGYLREEMVGKKILDFLTEGSRKTTLESMQKRILGAEQISEYEAGFIRKNGEIIQFIVRAIDITYSGEVATLALLLDISDRKRAEEALKMANMKLNLLSGITCHDIKNKLQILSGFIELSKLSAGDPVRVAELLKKEADTVAAISDLISFTQDYENLGIRAPAWQNVRGVLGTIIPQLPSGRNIRIDTGDPALEVFADPMLRRVFYNLFENAYRYGGEKMTTIRVTNHIREDGDLLVRVEDDGTGISAGDKPKLFTRGFGKNTGLGLFLSREILAITGITITESGEPGKGARFEIRVPKGEYRFSGEQA